MLREEPNPDRHAKQIMGIIQADGLRHFSAAKRPEDSSMERFERKRRQLVRERAQLREERGDLHEDYGSTHLYDEENPVLLDTATQTRTFEK